MANTDNKVIYKKRYLIGAFLLLQITFCAGQATEKEASTSSASIQRSPMFPQIHTNLNGMVSEFVRTMHQDKKGNYWFGANRDGIIRYDGQKLEKVTIEGVSPYLRVLEIAEDKTGNLWFATSDGLIKYNGEKFEAFSNINGEQGWNQEIWGLAIDKNGLIWVGWVGGLYQFDGKQFIPFPLPDAMVEEPKQMLSDKLVFKIIEDNRGAIWLVTDGNGIFKYRDGKFVHLTTENGLTDNNAFDIMEDKQGNIWIGTFNGGISKFDGTTFTNFTNDGIIDGIEAGSLYEDSKGNVWFTAEGFGVYRYDGAGFTQFTTKNGLPSNVVLSIFEDNKGQLWFGTWQGLCIFDGEKFVNAKDKEPWTN